VTAAVILDVAGGPMGGAARYRAEVYSYLDRTRREDVKVIGAERRVDPAWLLRREAIRPAGGRRVALNNVSFLAPGGERWTLVANPWDFMTDDEEAKLPRPARATIRHRASVVHLAARRSDVIIAPCTDMAERITRVVPSLRSRVVVRMHPVSADTVPALPRDHVILCPVLFSPYKRMAGRIAEWLTATDKHFDPAVRLLVTAGRAEVPADLARNPRIKLVGRLDLRDLRQLWACSRAVYFPTSVESFGYPLAEARVNGQPVIALDTPQNREIAGPALCGFAPGDPDSLRQATELALTADVQPDPAPFDPDAYFSWMLGPPL
jgi:glycosyltransferase involved in cell wall biosynthesis